MTNSLKILASVAICAVITTGTAFARDNDHDRGKTAASHRDAVRDHDRDHRRDARERREIRESREARERREVRARAWRRRHHNAHPQNAMFGKNGQPNGWSQGHKTGWSNCNVPPGQAKPAGCAPARVPRPAGDRDHDGDRR